MIEQATHVKLIWLHYRFNSDYTLWFFLLLYKCDLEYYFENLIFGKLNWKFQLQVESHIFLRNFRPKRDEWVFSVWQFCFNKMFNSWFIRKKNCFNFCIHSQKLCIHRNITAITSSEFIALNSEIAFTDVLKFRYRCWIIHIEIGISQTFN